jgi:hypothetical protein
MSIRPDHGALYSAGRWALLALGVIAVFPRSGISSDAQVLRSIRYVSQPDSAQVVVQLNGAVRYASRMLSNPPRLYIDFFDVSTVPELNGPSILGDNIFFSKIRVARRDSTTTRMVLDLKMPVDYTLTPFNGLQGLLLVLQRAKPGTIAKHESPQSVPARNSTTPAPTASALALRHSEISARSEPKAPATAAIVARDPDTSVLASRSSSSFAAPSQEPALPGAAPALPLVTTQSLKSAALTQSATAILRETPQSKTSISLAVSEYSNSSNKQTGDAVSVAEALDAATVATLAPDPPVDRPAPKQKPDRSVSTERPPDLPAMALAVPKPGNSTTPLETASVGIAERTLAIPAAIVLEKSTKAANSIDRLAATRNFTVQHLTIPRVFRAPKVEEFLGEMHGEGVRVTDFRQREPGDGKPVSQETSAYVSYDDKNVYVVFVCKDEPGKVRARMSKREDIGDDDAVSVYLDSFYDRQHAYYFTANPLGIQADGIVTEGQNKPDDLFDTLWHSEGQLTADGYVVWMAIPFKSVRFSSDAAQTWGVALGRSIARNSESAFWPQISRRNKNFISQMAALDGLDQISPSRNIQLIPYGAFTNAKLFDPGVPRYSTQNQGRVGLDSKIVLRDSLTLDVTLNPDFSQVESDDPQVTVNERYEVQFPEKRPFFIENAGYFQTPLDLFFSRRIVDPEFGARLTGKVGRWSVGLLGIDDRAPGRTVDPANPLFGEHAIIGAARIQREFGKDSRIGILATTRDFGSSYNRLFSIDTRLRLSPTWYFTGQFARSLDRSYDKKFNLNKAQGPASFAELTRSGRSFTYSADYQDLSQDFRAPLGFIKRVDLRQTSQYAAYFFHPESSKILSFGPSFTFGADWDHQGRLQDRYTNAEFAMDFSGPVGFKLTRYDAYEFYLNKGFRYQKSGVSFYANWIKWLNFNGSFQGGSGLNYTPANGLAPFVGTSQNASLGLTLRPTSRMRLDETYYFTRLGTTSGYLSAGGAPTVFTNHLARTKLNYQFTRALSLRAIVDYYGLLPNPGLFNSDRYKQLTGDILLTYMVNPRTALYIGYNNRHENWTIDPETPPMLRRYGSPSYLTGSQIFVKLSYLLRF